MKDLEGALKAKRRAEQQEAEAQGQLVDSWQPERGCPEELVEKALLQAGSVKKTQVERREQWARFPSLLGLVLPSFLLSRLGVDGKGVSAREWLLSFLWAIVARAGRDGDDDDKTSASALTPLLAFIAVILMACLPPPVAGINAKGSAAAVVDAAATPESEQQSKKPPSSSLFSRAAATLGHSHAR